MTPDAYQEVLRRVAGGQDAEPETLRRAASWRARDLEVLALGLDPALRLHRAAIVLHTEAALALLSDGEPAAGLAHLDIARGIARRLEHDTPFRQAWLVAIGMAIAARSDAPLALALFVECREAFPRAAEAWLGEGAVYEWSAFPDGLGGPRVPGPSRSLAREAERAYRAALAADPASAEARVRLGRVLQRIGRSDEARRELERATRRAREGGILALAHLFLGQVRESQGDRSGALRAYRAALAASPSLQPAAIALAALLVDRGERAQAIATLRGPLRGGDAEERPLWLAYRLGSPTRAEQALARVREQLRP
jgi:tetratricopeptide (TPR) repeat protein